MCLAIPGKIVEVRGETAIADFRGIKKKINVSLVNASLNDWVIVHAGFAIEKVHPEDSRVNPPSFLK